MLYYRQLITNSSLIQLPLPHQSGFYLRASKCTYIAPFQTKFVETHLEIKLPSGTVGLLVSPFTFNTSHLCVIPSCLESGDFNSLICVQLFNPTNNIQTVNIGDIIAKLLCIKCVVPNVVQTNDFDII